MSLSNVFFLLGHQFHKVGKSDTLRVLRQHVKEGEKRQYEENVKGMKKMTKTSII